MTHYPRAETFTLQLSDDFPLRGYSYVVPETSITRTSGYELDGRDLGQYGVTILEGSLAEVLKSPAVKQNLLQNLQRENGAIYDGEYVAFQTKEVKLKCSLRAHTFDEFWRNYNALLYDLTRPDERLLLSNTQAMNTRATIKVALRVSSYSHMGKYGGYSTLLWYSRPSVLKVKNTSLRLKMTC